jgi:ATP-dependent DNA ligase
VAAGVPARRQPDRSPEGRGRPLDWIPLAPRLVCEVAYDHVDRDRFRHAARFRRWRPDRDPRSCLLAQLDVTAHDPEEALAHP